MATFTHASPIQATPEELYRFHENPHNIRAVSPPSLHILRVEAEETARPGENFTLTLRQGPCTIRWAGRGEEAVPPESLIDTAINGPFTVWRHQHLFHSQEDGSTLLTDRVTFQLPWYLGGILADGIVRHLIFPSIFRARHSATRKWFSSPR